MEKPSVEYASSDVDLLQCSVDLAPGVSFGKSPAPVGRCSESSDVPRMDVTETESILAFCFELPGVDETSIDVSITRDTLSVRAERPVDARHNLTWLHRECSHASLQRTVLLPEGIDTEDVAMKFTNGLLLVKLSKLASQKSTRRIRFHS
jgi:HSP20 family protein